MCEVLHYALFGLCVYALIGGGKGVYHLFQYGEIFHVHVLYHIIELIGCMLMLLLSELSLITLITAFRFCYNSSRGQKNCHSIHWLERIGVSATVSDNLDINWMNVNIQTVYKEL